VAVIRPKQLEAMFSTERKAKNAEIARLKAERAELLAALEAALPILHCYIAPDQFDGHAARALIVVKEAIAKAKETS
jgi:hypothetical protein